MDHQTFAQILANYGEFIGAIAVVVTLFYLATQVRHSKDATEANTRSLEQSRELAFNEAGWSFATKRNEFRNSIIQNADVWTRGNLGQSLDRVEREAYTQLILENWDVAFWTDLALNRLSEIHNVGIHDFAVLLSQNPGARATWEESMRVEQAYRDRLLSEPGIAGAEQVQMVLEDLEKLIDDASNVAAHNDS